MFNNLSYSAFAAACFSSSVRGFAGAFSSRWRSSSWRFLSIARSRSTSRGRGSLRRGGECDREYERRRSGGASRRGEGEREDGARLRVMLSGAEASPSTEGSRAGGSTTAAMSDLVLIAHPIAALRECVLRKMSGVADSHVALVAVSRCGRRRRGRTGQMMDRHFKVRPPVETTSHSLFACECEHVILNHVHALDRQYCNLIVPN